MIITISIQKGGQGKTTTTHNIGFTLNKLGYTVLLVDFDSQQSLSTVCDSSSENTLVELAPNIDLLAFSQELAEQERNIKADYLKTVLGQIQSNYDYILIDTPPSLNNLTVAALTVADYVLIPAQANILSLKAIGQLTNTIKAIKGKTNKKLKVAGIMLNCYDGRRKLTGEVLSYLEEQAEVLGCNVFIGHVRNSATVEKGQAYGKSVIDFDKRSAVAQDYIDITKELLEVVNNG